MRNESYRGKLVGIIVKSIGTTGLLNHLSLDEIKELLQDRLNSNLKFKTDISDIKSKGEFAHGQIFFTDENGDTRVIDFTITEWNFILPQ